MYEVWYDYVKPKYNDKAKLCYMDTDSFVLNIFTEDFFEDINNDVERWFDTSYLYAKDPYECKYQCLINKREGAGMNHFRDPNTFIEYSNGMCSVYKKY